MPVYAYKGVDTGGKTLRGHLDAENPRTARSRLKRDGIFVTDFQETRTEAAQRSGSSFRSNIKISLPNLQRVSAMDQALMTRQLATLIGAGIPLVDSLRALTDQTENRVSSATGTSEGIGVELHSNIPQQSLRQHVTQVHRSISESLVSRATQVRVLLRRKRQTSEGVVTLSDESVSLHQPRHVGVIQNRHLPSPLTERQQVLSRDAVASTLTVRASDGFLGGRTT